MTEPKKKQLKTKQGEVHVEEDYVTKKLSKPKPWLTPTWLEYYKDLSDANPDLIKVYEIIDQQTYRMERIDIINNLEVILKEPEYYTILNKQIISEVIRVINESWVQAIKYSNRFPELHKYYVNTDLTLDNLVLTTDYKVRVVDPESYNFVDNLDYTEKYYLNQVNLMYKLQKYFYTVIDRNHMGPIFPQ